VKVSLFADDMILYPKDSGNFTQKLLDIINSFSNVAGYKIDLQNSLAFLYINNEQIENEYWKTTQFKITSKKIKYLGIYLTKDVNDLDKENYKPLQRKKEIKKDYRRWKDLPCSWISRINIKNGYTIKSNLYVQCNSHQNPNDIHHRDKIYPKVHLETQNTMNSQGNSKLKVQCWRYHNAQLQTILYSHNNKNSMVLAQKQV
jgi:hypothetical protein